MPRVPLASEDERKFIVDGIQVRVFIVIYIEINALLFRPMKSALRNEKVIFSFE
jgi:hypothetical protein